MTSVDSEFDGAGELTEIGDALSAFDAPDISPEEYAEHWGNMMANALSATKLIGVVEVRSGIGQVHIMGRVRRDQERMFLEKVIEKILKFLDRDDDCHGFVGKQFLIKDDNVRYAWVISLASNDLKSTVAKVCMSFESAIPKVEVSEAPLLGPSTPQSGGQKSGRKGASPVN
jgi:hypothetical protein